MTDFNAAVIAEFREKNGVVTDAAPFGDALVVMHTIGAKSGVERLAPVVAIADDDAEGEGWLVAASKAGAPTNPDWYHNLLAHPDLNLETGDGESIRSVDVHATDLQGAERDAAWERFKQASDGFRQYEEKTSRVIPVLRLAAR